MKNCWLRVLLCVCSILIGVSAVNAEIVRVDFSGATLEGTVAGDIDYLPGETFSGYFILDTSVATDTAGDPNVGLFRDSNNFGTVSGINRFEFSTSQRGPVVFDRGQVTGPPNSAVVTDAQQILFAGPDSTLSNQTFLINNTPATFPGNTPVISGDLMGLKPFSVLLQLQSLTTGTNPRSLFDDPNTLASGPVRNFALDDTSIGDQYTVGTLTMVFTDIQDTTLVISDISYSVVPIPAAGLLFATALGILGWSRKSVRKTSITPR